MIWLSLSEAREMSQRSGHHRPQMISLAAEVSRLDLDISVPPTIVPPEQGPPTTLRIWWAETAGRIISVCAEEFPTTQAVTIWTSFLPTQDSNGDWAVLLDLIELPKSINVRHPYFIESRNRVPHSTVMLRDSRGWCVPVYKAASGLDADSLLSFVNQEASQQYFSKAPEPDGTWRIMQGDQVIYGIAESLLAALNHAHHLSERYPSKAYLVVDVTGQNTTRYHISEGRVIEDSMK